MSDHKKYLRNFGEMRVVRSIAMVKSKLEDQGKACMFQRMVLSLDLIWLNKTYGEYMSRKENTKADSYIIQN